MKRGYTHSRSASATPSSREPLAHLVRRRERVLGRDVVAVGGQAAEVGRARGHQLRPPVGEVRRHLDADVGHQPPRLGDQPLHVLDRSPASPSVGAPCTGPSWRPVRQNSSAASVGDLGRLLAVVAPVRDEVLQDHLLQVVEARQRLERRHAVVLGLADADEDPARERDPQLLRRRDRREPRGSGCLVGDPWWATRSGLTDSSISPCDAVTSRRSREILAAQHAEVGVREQPALERPLARPHHIGREAVEAELARAVACTPGWWSGASPVSTSSSLTWRRAARSISRSTSSGSWRCV